MTDPEHMIDLVSSLGYRVLEHRRKPRSTSTLDQIITTPTGVVVIEFVRVSAPDHASTTPTIAARVLRKVESVRQALAEESTPVRGVAVVEGFEGTSSSYGVLLTGACPGWLIPSDGPLLAEHLARIATTLGSAFPGRD